MKLLKINFLIVLSMCLFSCADYTITKHKEDKIYYSSKGFALIYEDSLYEDKIVTKKYPKDDFQVIHSSLKKGTIVQIINPENSKAFETKVYTNADYPKIFNIVINEKIASILKLDVNNPYIEVSEIKKNKTFVAKKANTFDEEKNVVEKAPVEEIQVDDLSKNKKKLKKKAVKKKNYTIIISDFYYENSAYNLMKDLAKKTRINNMSVKKINDKKYRLLVGPFENFSALKTSYISLNNLGFEELNIHKY